MRGLAAGFAVAVTLGACSTVPNPAYTAAGWYLEKPRQTVVAGPRFYGGPFSYDQCEAERTKLPQRTAEEMICFRQIVPPGVAGPYVTDMDVVWANGNSTPPAEAGSPGATPDVNVTPTPPVNQVPINQ